ncbi:hypothetical protein NX722_26140 [Endozoicomonas gorgoniicola]|uniref:Uncharacterized protein n=1 Tax=Endozoicomonas gorgoniicola TaxID=1234144 RepID=A0ABT3N337_9GAMM|nr:hypothetical protein [Endozoicomonas gorgoniicola]MCW7556045.1 hypothetical protein [Endozoicomonas gorgoniicola]
MFCFRFVPVFLCIVFSVSVQAVRDRNSVHRAEFIKCKMLEGQQSCLPTAIVAALEGRDLLTGIMNRFQGSTPSSIYHNVNIQVRSCPYARLVVVSHYLANHLEGVLADPFRLEMLRSALASLPNAQNSIIMTALQWLDEGVSTSTRHLITRELLNDIRLGLDQMDNLEILVLLAMATRRSILVVDDRQEDTQHITIIRRSHGHLSVETQTVTNLQLNEDSVHELIRSLTFQANLHFIVSPQLMPVLPFPPITPVHVARSGESQPLHIDLNRRVVRPLVSTDGGDYSAVPVKSKNAPRLNPRSIRKVRPKWKNQDIFRQTFFRQTYSTDSFAGNVIKASFVSVLLIGATHPSVKESVKRLLWQVACREKGIRQCGVDYLNRAVDTSRYIRAEVYYRICGKISWNDCKQYYLDNYISRDDKKEE